MSGVYSTGPGGGDRDTTVRDLLAVVFRRKWLILGIFFFVTGIVLFRTVTAPVSYSADATLMLNRQGLRSSQLENRGSNLPWVEVIESEMEVIRSTPVLQAASARLAEPREAFPEGLDVGPGALASRVRSGVIGESNVLYITGSWQDPQAAVAITNAVARSYIEYHREFYQLPDASSLIHVRADSTLRELQALQARREQLLSEVGLTELKEEEGALIRRRHQLSGELSELNLDRRQLETEVADGEAYLEGGSLVVGAPFQQSSGTIQGVAISRTVQALSQQTSVLEDLRSRYTPNHPKVVEQQRMVDELTRQVRSAVEQAVASRRHELRVVGSKVAELQSEVAGLDRQLAQLPAVRSQVELLDARIRSTTDHYEELAEQAVDSEIRTASFADYSVKLLSPALNARRNQKGDMVRLALGPILALMVGIGLAFYMENLDHSVTNREDVERHLEIPVLASFPDVDLPEREGAPPQRRGIPFAGRKGG